MITLPPSTGSDLLVGVKTISNKTPPTSVTVTCAEGDAFNKSGGPVTTVDVSALGAALLLQYNHLQHAWYPLGIDIETSSVAVSPPTVVPEAVNTGYFFQSNSGLDPTGATAPLGLFFPPSAAVWGLTNTFAEEGTADLGSIYQILSVLENTGNRSAIAVAGFATGERVWGGNFGVEASGDGECVGIGVEVDFGLIAASTGMAVGLHLGAQGGAGNPAEFVSLTAEGFSYPGPKSGYSIGVLGEQDLVTLSVSQVPDVTGTLILSSSTPVTLPLAGIPTFDALHPGAFVYNGNYYLFGGVAETYVMNDTLTGVTLYSGSPAMSIPPAATIVVGTQPLGVGAVTANITSANGAMEASQTITTTPSDLMVGSTLGFPASGTCVVGGVAGVLVGYTGTSGGNELVDCTVASGSYTALYGAPVWACAVNVMGHTISSTPSTLTVTSNAGFSATGGICSVAGVLAPVTYTGMGGTTMLLDCTVPPGSGSFTATDNGPVIMQPAAGSPGALFEVINKVSTGKAIDLLQGIYAVSGIHVPASSIVSSPAVEVTATGGTMSTAEGILFSSADASTAAFGISFDGTLTLVTADLTFDSETVTGITPAQAVGAVFNIVGSGVPPGATVTITGTGTGTLSTLATASGTTVPLALSGEQFVDPTGTLLNATGIFAKASDLTHGVYSVAGLQVPACSSTGAPAVEVTAIGGAKSSGAGILFDSGDTSTVEYGIRFLDAGLTDVTATLSSSESVTAINFAQPVGGPATPITGPGIPSGATLLMTARARQEPCPVPLR